MFFGVFWVFGVLYCSSESSRSSKSLVSSLSSVSTAISTFSVFPISSVFLVSSRSPVSSVSLSVSVRYYFRQDSPEPPGPSRPDQSVHRLLRHTASVFNSTRWLSPPRYSKTVEQWSESLGWPIWSQKEECSAAWWSVWYRLSGGRSSGSERVELPLEVHFDGLTGKIAGIVATRRNGAGEVEEAPSVACNACQGMTPSVVRARTETVALIYYCMLDVHHCCQWLTPPPMETSTWGRDPWMHMRETYDTTLRVSDTVSSITKVELLSFFHFVFLFFSNSLRFLSHRSNCCQKQGA